MRQRGGAAVSRTRTAVALAACLLCAIPASAPAARSKIPLAGNYYARSSQIFHGKHPEVQFQFHPRKVRRFAIQYVLQCTNGRTILDTYQVGSQATGKRGSTVTDPPRTVKGVAIDGDNQPGSDTYSGTTSFKYAGPKKIKGYFQITDDFYHANGELAYHCTMPRATFTAKRIGKELHPEH
jgi:hypothetical protein